MPNYRRARTLALKIEATRFRLEEVLNDPSCPAEHIEDLKEELNHLEYEFFLTGVTSEYDL